MGISKIQIEYFGDPLIRITGIHFRNRELELPNSFKYNSGWRMKHQCEKCSSDITIEENFEERKKNFKVLKMVNSKKNGDYLIAFLAEKLSGIELLEIKGVKYLNIRDFDYSNELQKISSIDLIDYNCPNCGSRYLARASVFYPLLPEKNLPQGKFGAVSFFETVLAEKDYF